MLLLDLVDLHRFLLRNLLLHLLFHLRLILLLLLVMISSSSENVVHPVFLMSTARVVAFLFLLERMLLQIHLYRLIPGISFVKILFLLGVRFLFDGRKDWVLLLLMMNGEIVRLRLSWKKRIERIEVEREVVVVDVAEDLRR